MKTKAISSIFVLFAIAAGMASMAPAAFADHAEVTIRAADNSGSPGSCDIDCYMPGTATVDVGGVVTMINSDASRMMHTFTSGTGPGAETDVFDSSYLQFDMIYEWSPTEAGEVAYYCQLHPWMIGSIIVQEVAAEKDAHEGHDEGHDMKEMEMSHSDEPLLVEISTNTADAGEMLTIDVTFTTVSGESVSHINYNIEATQNGEVVLEPVDVHDHDGVNEHMTAPLPAATSTEEPVEVKVTFNGYGMPGEEMTGPIGEVTTKQVVPEFGTIAMMILAVAIISIVAVTAKSRVVPRF